jgi:hypothetical protein
VILALFACAPEPEGQPFLRLRGEVDPEVVIDGEEAVAQVLWVTAVDGELCVEVDPVPFYPYLLQYEAIVEAPPSLDGEPCVPAPPGLEQARTGWGLLVVASPSARGELQITADPSGLLGWFAGSGEPLGPLLVAEEGRVAASASRVVLIVDASEAPLSGEWCRFGALVPGLAPYIDRGLSCDGWEPIAEPGVHSEVQGVDLEAL